MHGRAREDQRWSDQISSGIPDQQKLIWNKRIKIQLAARVEIKFRDDQKDKSNQQSRLLPLPGDRRSRRSSKLPTPSGVFSHWSNGSSRKRKVLTQHTESQVELHFTFSLSLLFFSPLEDNFMFHIPFHHDVWPFHSTDMI